MATRSSGSMQVRHREAIFERWRSDILREAIDLDTLGRVAVRMGHDPNVRADPVLAAELRGVIAEKEAELKAIRRQQDADSDAPPPGGSGAVRPVVGGAGVSRPKVGGAGVSQVGGAGVSRPGAGAVDSRAGGGDDRASTMTGGARDQVVDVWAGRVGSPGLPEAGAPEPVERGREGGGASVRVARDGVDGGAGEGVAASDGGVGHGALPESPSGAVRYMTVLRHQFEGFLAHGDAGEAEAIFARIESARRRYPELMDAAEHERLAGRLEHVQRRHAAARARVDDLARRALSAAAAGDHDTVSRVLRRLGVLHASIPGALSDARYQALHDQIVNASEVHEHREAARALLKRESEVAAEIRRMARAIRVFHDAARHATAGEDVAAAERAFRRAEAELAAHDREWLAGLILEMLDMAEACHGPRGRVDRHVDSFVASLRTALERLKAEVREIEGGG